LNYVSVTETDVTDGLGRVTKYTFDTTKGRRVTESKAYAVAVAQ
jgi:hypothetical protein